ncbi:unnamed protein product [Paramecium sonneborni]|uniref:Uncharacterized protein n=1 Tax=Paramecium sonneborni TaxID=65129 RepID=A0A8S1MVL5_9CILI|nr:unnamed protein product [Paramecium sonneborni]
MYKNYENMWEQNQNNFQIMLPQLTNRLRKDFFFILEFPKFYIRTQDNQRNQMIMEVNLQINDQSINKNICKQQNKEDLEIQKQYYRMIVKEIIIDQARKACEQYKFEKVQDKIHQMIPDLRFNLSQINY